jgi:hypothetical protein
LGNVDSEWLLFCGFGADVVLYVGKRVDYCVVVSTELFRAAINNVKSKFVEWNPEKRV